MNVLFKVLGDLPDIGINANEWTSGLAASVGPWVAGGLGLGAVILGVMIGWSSLRRICNPGGDDPYEDYTYDDWLEDSAEHYEGELATDRDVAEYAADLGDAGVEAVEANAEMGEFSADYGIHTEDIDPDDLVTGVDPDRVEGEDSAQEGL